MAITKVGENQNFGYTGGVQSFTVPFDGFYKLEVWGAQGGKAGSFSTTYTPKGGYSVGYISLKKGQVLYVVCGQQGYGQSGGTASARYNGGGSASGYESLGIGGGATHIAKSNNRGELKNYSNYKSEILIVAGGGGGGYARYASGYGGGSTGSAGATAGGTGGSGGTQSSGGSGNGTGGFGYGANTSNSTYETGGGGGGWYGGGGGGPYGGGGGGSGYIGGVPATTYNGTTYSPSTSNNSNTGNGRAVITLVGFSKLFNFDGTDITSLKLDGTQISSLTYNTTKIY